MKTTSNVCTAKRSLMVLIGMSLALAGCVAGIDDTTMGDGVESMATGEVINDQVAASGVYQDESMDVDLAIHAAVEAGLLPGEEAGAPGELGGEYEVAAGCSGARIEHIPVKYGSSTYGYLDVYYNSATGRNCAMTRTTGSVYGHASYIDVRLFRCTQTSPGSNCTVDTGVIDDGAFHYYAGPVSLYAASRCIYVDGVIIYNGKAAYAQTSPDASHCGS